MELWASVVDRASDLRSRIFDGSRTSDDNSPVEIQKRLQREAFSDIMKLRERQDKVERLLTVFSNGKTGPFAGASARVTGLVNAAGALFFRPEQKEQKEKKEKVKAFDDPQISTGLDSRFMFQTTVRENDSLAVELAADSRYIFQEQNLGSPFVLTKVAYSASINDRLLLLAIPVGAKCEDFSAEPYPQKGPYATGYSSSMRPPLFRDPHKYATGLLFRSKDFAASIAGLVYDQWRQTTAESPSNSLSTYGQISYNVSEQSKVTLSAAWQGAYIFPRHVNIGNYLCSLGSPQTRLLTGSNGRLGKKTPGQSVAVEVDVDEDTKIGGWIEVERSNPRVLTWAVSLLDCPEGEIGWGASLKRRVEGKSSQFHAESFLAFGLGRKGSLQPGIALTMNGKSYVPSLVLRSTWSL